MDHLTDGLTPAQADAVRHLDGPMLTIAGPGSGKTRVVTHRIAHMLHRGVRPWQIAALTFTNKAAEEMKSRLGLLVPDQRVWMGTFHRFCAQQLRRHASMVGLGENYSILDTSDSKAALKRAIAAAGVSTTHQSPEQIAAAISRCKNRLITPEIMAGQTLRASETIAAKVYPVYQQQLKTANAVDFDDLLMHVAMMLRENPEFRAELDAKLKYILVDEYQDTNLAQYAIVRALSVDHPNLAVTGDPDQSIYGWRGADINNILDFEKDYPNVKIVRLEQNYRSTPEILRVADQLIRHNRRRKQKDLYTSNPTGDPVVLQNHEDGFKEADAIADEIAGKMLAGVARPNDYAIFCRMNALTRSLEHALRSRGIPYQIAGGVEFYQRKEIKDLLAFLHLINNPSHDVALQRIINVPTRGIGATSLTRLRAFADAQGVPMLDAARRVREIDTLAKRSQTMIGNFVRLYDRLRAKATATLEDILRYLVEETNYEKYLEKTAVEGQDNIPMANVDELITAAVEFDRQHPEDGSLDLFLEQIALVADTDALEDNTDRVTLMTLHAAKGLEFNRVFVIAVEDDLLPHARSKESDAEIEEERRLLFVGVTRARKWLQLSYVKRRQIRGDWRPVVPSPFLNELPRDEMLVVEHRPHDNFDEYFQDDQYPESWDLQTDDSTSQEPESLSFPSSSTASAIPAMYQEDAPAKKPRKISRSITPGGGLKTASDLLADPGTSLMSYKIGSRVRHEVYGVGEIISLTGRGPKRIAKIKFDSAVESFRLAHAKLVLMD